MQRRVFILLFLAILFVVTLHAFIWQPFAWLYFIVGPLAALGLYDVLQTQHSILRNFPIVGHFRYLFESVRPQIYQYFIESDQEGRPLSREQRDVIYQRAKGMNDTQPYGTKKNVEAVGYEWINHSMNAKTLTDLSPRILIGNAQCTQPYSASILNISAMSFGAISQNAVLALNRGAKRGNFYHNTGEGGLSSFHLQEGGDIVWQIGSGYFGCRNHDGTFNPSKFAKKATHESVKMIEIKLSQGAKAGHGGILPAAKITQQIAEIRDVPMGADVISPARHSMFSTPIEMMEFIAQLRTLSEGKPIGFKLCLGSRREFMCMVKAMLETSIFPDFITIDGAEGGTGATPLEFANAVGTPLNEALVFIHNSLVGAGIRQHIKLIASGKLLTGFQHVHKLAMGADALNSARAMMLALGCIQSLRCNTNECPTGIATQDPSLVYGLVVKDKSERVYRYHKEAVKVLCELVGAAGLSSPSELRPGHIYRRVSRYEVLRLDDIYEYIEEGSLLSGDAPLQYLSPWLAAEASQF